VNFPGAADREVVGYEGPDEPLGPVGIVDNQGPLRPDLAHGQVPSETGHPIGHADVDGDGPDPADGKGWTTSGSQVSCCR
jgi:hypothetical protein